MNPARHIRIVSYATALILWSVIVSGGAEPAAKRAVLSANRMVMVDGQPRFIIGLYETLTDEALLKEAAGAGFNLVRSPANAESLDRLARHGVKAWINLGGLLDLRGDVEAKRAKLIETVHRWKDHPALLLWEAPDEPLWNAWYGKSQYFTTVEFPAMSAAAGQAGEKRGDVEAMIRQCRDRWERGQWSSFEAVRERVWASLGQSPPKPEMKMSTAEQDARELGDGLTLGFEAVRQADPDHAIWLNHAPRNSIEALQHFNRSVDLAGCDIYPVPFNLGVGHSDLTDMNLTAVGAYSDRMQAGAPGKGLVMVLQGFGWRDLRKDKSADVSVGRRPSLKETRFMAYDAIAHGASAIMYWGTAYIEKDSQLWRDLLTVVRELRALAPALVVPPRAPPRVDADETFGSVDGKGPVMMLRRVEEDYVLVAVNEQRHGVTFEVSALPRALRGRTLYRLGSEEAHTVTPGGTFRDGIRALDVHVYATSRRFEPAGAG